MAHNPILFCFVAWMEHYEGNPQTDIPRGGGRYIHENGYGYEIYNFRKEGSKYYGYVSTMRGTIRIENLGALAGSDSVSGVNVVFVAHNPTLGCPVVVGWYQNARVYRRYQPATRGLHRRYKTEQLDFNIVAPVKGSYLLPVEDRMLDFPDRAEGGFGQSRLRYPDQTKHRDFLTRLSRFMQGEREPKAPATPNGGGGRQPDFLKRQEAERAAINAVTRHFERRGFSIDSREKECVGWDLEAIKGRTKLLLEVKGTAASEFVCELTPNEYSAMQRPSIRDTYRVCVVTNALAKRPNPPRIFYWSSEESRFTDGRRLLQIQERTAALIRI